MKNVAVLLPFEEVFSTLYGGAIARWVYEVYSRLPDVFCVVVGRIDRDNKYNIRTTSSRYVICEAFFRVPYVRRLCHWLYILQSYKDIFNADVVHVHNSPKYVPFLRRLGFDSKITLHMHNNYFSRIGLAEIRKLESLDFDIVVCSRFLKREIETRSFELGARTTIIPNGVDLSSFNMGKVKTTRTVKKVLFLGRIDEGKGLFELLQAVYTLPAEYLYFSISVVGSTHFGRLNAGAYYRKCFELAERINANQSRNIIFWEGFKSHKEGLVEIIASADILVCPSVCDEAFGMAIIEAMACGLPVIAFDSGGISELVEGVGVLVPAGDVERLATAINTLLADEVALQKLSERSFEKSRAYDWHGIASVFGTYLGRPS